MTEVRELKPIEWAGVIPIFKKVFNDSDVPPPEHGKFIGVFEDGRLEAFLMLEEIVMIDQVWSRQSENSIKYLKRLVQFTRDSVPERQTVGTVFDGTRYEMLFRMLGFLKVPGILFRRNGK